MKQNRIKEVANSCENFKLETEYTILSILEFLFHKYCMNIQMATICTKCKYEIVPLAL